MKNSSIYFAALALFFTATCAWCQSAAEREQKLRDSAEGFTYGAIGGFLVGGGAQMAVTRGKSSVTGSLLGATAGAAYFGSKPYLEETPKAEALDAQEKQEEQE